MGPFPRRLQAVRFHFGWILGGAKEVWMNGWRERAADIFTKYREIAAKMKSAPGPGPSDFRVYSADAHLMRRQLTSIGLTQRRRVAERR